MKEVYIGIGSNIDPEENIRRAAKKLEEAWPTIRFSSLYRSAPLLAEDQAYFLNAAASFQTDQAPEEVLNILQSIEHELKKAPPYRYGPRTIDLDLLLVGDLVSEKPGLSLPHPEIARRKFVLLPLLELIEPNTKHPVLHRTFESLLEEVGGQECEKVEFNAE